jgi:hypothetical protein
LPSGDLAIETRPLRLIGSEDGARQTRVKQSILVDRIDWDSDQQSDIVRGLPPTRTFGIIL